MSAVSEMLAGAVGILHPEPLKPQDISAIKGLASAWQRRLYLWIFGGKEEGTEAGLRPWEPSATPGWLRCWDSLTRVIDLEPMVQALVDAGQNDVALEVVQIVTSAREQLLLLFPEIEVEEVGGNIRVPPSDDEAWDWVSQVGVLDSQDRFIRELEYGTIEAAQVEQFQEAFPETFQLIHETIFGMVKHAKDNSIPIPWDVQDTIMRAALLAEPQQPAVDHPAEDAPKPKSAGKMSTADSLTAAQKVDVPSSAL